MDLQLLSKYLKSKYGINVNGVLHIGAHTGEEREEYHHIGCPVVWIEGDPDTFSALQKNIADYPNQLALYCLCSAKSGDHVIFHRASNGGHSSSVLPPDEKMLSLWNISVADAVELKTERLDEYLVRNEIDLGKINFVNIDVQGYELPALRGLSDLLTHFDVVVSELNWTETYKGTTRPVDLETYLMEFGFCRAFLSVGYPQGYGIWVRQKCSWASRYQMVLSMRIIQMLADIGFVRIIQQTTLRKWLRSFYYWLTSRIKDS